MTLPGRMATVVVVVGALALAGWLARDRSRPAAASEPVAMPATAPVPATGTPFESTHYAIRSTASDAQTRRVAADVEVLHATFLAFFPDLPARPASAPRLQLVLYGSRAEFQANNRSQPWAEAYYLAPAAYAYVEPGEARASHWMLHEAVHQLSREVAGFRKARWSDEGLAAYFATSRLRDGLIALGEPDPETYPLWWLADLQLSGDRARDFAAERLVPLKALISGEGGPPIARTVNAHYIGYWSLVHFLLHHEDGRHAAAFRALLPNGGGLAEFEQRVGPLAVIEPQWYAHLQQQVEALRACATAPCADDAVIVVP
jgi:hypothetical protein